MYVLFNGQLIHENEVTITASDRGLAFGDGIFETMLYQDGHIRFLDDHLLRLKESTKALKINLPEPFSFEGQVKTLIDKNKIDGTVRVKLMVWRQGGGTFAPESSNANYLLIIKPHVPFSPVINNCGFFEAIKIAPSSTSRFKTLSSLPYVMAGLEMKEQGWDDIIMTGSHNRVVECLHSNLYWIKNNILYTPSLESGCIEGVSRKNILRTLHELEYPYEEGFYTKEDLLSADVIFTSNATGIRMVLKTENNAFQSQNEVVDALKNSLFV